MVQKCEEVEMKKDQQFLCQYWFKQWMVLLHCCIECWVMY